VKTGPVSQAAAAPSAENRQKRMELFRSRQVSDEALMVSLGPYAHLSVQRSKFLPDRTYLTLR
jgi:hypothetical protein